MTVLNDVIADLRTDRGVEILCRKCHTLGKMRWIYAVDVLRFVLCRNDAVETVRFFFSHNAIPDSLQTRYWIFLPLNLFLRSMEARDRKLYEVLPLSREVISQFQTIPQRLVEDEDIAILGHAIDYFLARLNMNAFEVMITAWVLSCEGRKWLRSSEQRFLTQFQYESALPVLKCVQDLKACFWCEFEPWTHPVAGGEDEDHSSQSGTLEVIPLPLNTPLTGTDIPSQAHTAVAEQRHTFGRLIAEEYSKFTNEPLCTRLDAGALFIAIREMATALEMDPDHIEQRLCDWIFTLAIPTDPTLPDQHWRNLHAHASGWQDLARIGRYTSMGTSEAEMERLPGEQQDIQGRHGTN
jgi:hypothetical protein